MKLPKDIIIGGRTWTIINNSKIKGGSFKQNQITIGTKSKNTDEIIQTFLHEVIEAILSEKLLRFELPYNKPYLENGDYLFVFNHRDFEESVKDISLALKEVLK